MTDKVVSVRLDSGRFDKLQALAFVDDTSVGGLIRAAVDRLIAERESDPKLQEQAEHALERRQEILSALHMASG